jgi:transcription initiation factor TFIIB
MSERDPKEEARVRNLKRALNEADRLSDELDLPRSVRTIATSLYRRARKKDLLPGHGVEQVVAASLYIGCKQEGVPRSPDDFAEHSEYDRKYILRTAKYFEKELDLNLEPFEPKPYIERFAKEAGLGEVTIKEAKDIVDYCIENGVHSGCSPSGVAAAAVYLAGRTTNNKVTQKKVAGIAEVTEVTIRSRYQEQLEALPEDWEPRTE